ncbi:hypothetical protein [Rheinheimera gaetbuli]
MSIETLSGTQYQPGIANQTPQTGGSTPLGSGNGNDPPTSKNVSTTDTVTISAEAQALLEAEDSAPVQPMGSGNGNDPPKSE